MIYTIILCLVFIVCVPIVEFSGVGRQTGYIVMSGIGVGVAVAIAGLMVMTMDQPVRWKHTYKPVMYDTEMMSRMRSLIGTNIVPPMMFGYQDRVKACLALREAFAEYIELTWTTSPYDFSRMMTTPSAAYYLQDKPYLRKMLVDMRDLGVFNRDSSLMYSKRRFLNFMEKVFEEVDEI
jgi:hypothetical protein